MRQDARRPSHLLRPPPLTSGVARRRVEQDLRRTRSRRPRYGETLIQGHRQAAARRSSRTPCRLSRSSTSPVRRRRTPRPRHVARPSPACERRRSILASACPPPRQDTTAPKMSTPQGHFHGSHLREDTMPQSADIFRAALRRWSPRVPNRSGKLPRPRPNPPPRPAAPPTAPVSVAVPHWSHRITEHRPLRLPVPS